MVAKGDPWWVTHVTNAGYQILVGVGISQARETLNKIG